MRNHKKLCDLGRCQETWLYFSMELDVSLHAHGGHDGILLKCQHSLGMSQKPNRIKFTFVQWRVHSGADFSSEIRVVMWIFYPSLIKFFFGWAGREQNENMESFQFGFLVSQWFSFYSYVQNNKWIARWAGVWWKCKARIYSSVQCTVWPLCSWKNLIVSLCVQEDELLCCSLNGRARRQLFVAATVKTESSSNDFPHRCFPCVWM